MGIKASIFIFLIGLFFGQVAIGQDSDLVEYQEAKRLFNVEDYLSARGAFQRLATKEAFRNYGTFYQALCSYYLGDGASARSLWGDLLTANSTWNQRDEIVFWLTVSHYQDGLYRDGIKYAEQLTRLNNNSEIEINLANLHLFELPLDTLLSLSEEFADNRAVGSVLAGRLFQEQVSYQRNELLNTLVKRFGLKRSILSDSITDNVFRECYSIGIFLPFMFESMENPWQTVNNKIVMELYQGMIMAVKDLSAQGISVKLYPFDTKRSKEHTLSLLSNDTLKNLDLIIGPIFPGPSEAVASFSKEYQINMINPLSTNPEVIGDNSYSFLLKPTYETIARALAKHVIKSVEHPIALIYFERSERDSLFAAIYREEIDTAGFEVVDFRSLETLEAKILLDTLIAQHEEFLTQEEADSIMLIPGRFVKSRRLKEEELTMINGEEEDDVILKDSVEMAQFDSLILALLPFTITEEKDTIIYYEMKFNMAKDSIGHIMMASRNNVFANNMISAVETRDDTTRLFGYGNWFDFNVISYDQLERLQIELAYPEFIDKDKNTYDSISKSIMRTYGVFPSEYHFTGYQVLEFGGKMLAASGKYFQYDFGEMNIIPGSLYEGFWYGSSNDNQIVPIVTLQYRRLKAINKPYLKEEDE